MGKTKISWRREPSGQGLARVSESPRGYLVKINGADAGGIFAHPVGWLKWEGWYWHVYGPSVPSKNTSSKPVATIEKAKAECEAYIRAHADGPALT